MLTSILSDYSFVITIIFICSLVQSLFGVGILLFGTPTFLFFGFSFEEALTFTLPSSLSISILQILSNYEVITDKKTSILIIMPSLFIGLLLLIYINNSNIIQLLVGVMLVLVAITRFSIDFNNIVTIFIKKYQNITLAMTGFIHGFTNLGGGLLTFYSSTKYSDKKMITANIAFIYAIFAIIQLTFLSLSSKINFHIISLILPIISGLIFIFSGKYLIENIRGKDYAKIITLIIFIYGLLSILGFFKQYG